MLAVAVTVAVAVSACGGSSSKSSSPSAVPSSSDHAAISRAADVSESAKGYTYRFSEVEAAQGDTVAKISGSGAYSAVEDSLAMTLTTDIEGKRSQVQEIGVGPRYWVKEPAAVAAKLPGGKMWLEIDLEQAGPYLKAMASLAGSTSDTDPAQSLQLLRDESSQVQDLGAVTLNGVPTTHYRGSVNLEKAGTGRSAAVRAASQKLLKTLPGKIPDETDVPVDVWIDDAHFVRQLSYKISVIPKGTSQAFDVSVELTMTHYGPQTIPPPPPASETVNLLAVLKAEGKSGATAA